jgi:hypothetical protein
MKWLGRAAPGAIRNLLHHPSGSIATTRSCSNNSSIVSPEQLATSTHRWFHSVVVGQKLCPFAPPLLANPELLRMVVSGAQSTHEAVAQVAEEVELLVGNESQQQSSSSTTTHETTLVVLNAPFVDDFRDFVRLSWELQAQAVGTLYQNDLQLVLFHPQATHQTYAATPNDDDDDDSSLAADYTIRSPYPTVHLLREVDVMRAVQSNYPNLETLPSRNKAKLIAQGIDVCKQRLNECLQATEIPFQEFKSSNTRR